MKKILIVEDNEDSAEMLSMLLKFQGHLVQCVNSGHTGISLASTWNPDVIIVDLGLPDINGLEVIRELSTVSRTVIALTGQNDTGIRHDADKAGADHFFVKGDEISNLLSLL
jgi:DNA-binding response OmpR family regulator